MPSQRAADHIRQSLAEQERQEDFEYLLDALVGMRRPYHPDTDLFQAELAVGTILCWIVIIKPRNYVSAMQEFRVLFRGVAETPQLQGIFANSVRPAALMVRSEAGCHFQPCIFTRGDGGAPPSPATWT
jgi:hypothetical protein